MRKFLSFITAMVMFAALPSCNSLENKLNGLWVAEDEVELAADKNLKLTTALLLELV